MPHSEGRLRSWQTTAYAVWSIVGIILLLWVAGWLLGRLSAALVPFIIAFIFVFLLQGPVLTLERRGVPRGVAAAACFVIGIALLAMIFTFVLPVAARQLNDISRNIPGWVQAGQEFIESAQQQYRQLTVPEWVRTAVQSLLASVTQIVLNLGERTGTFLLAAGGGIATGIFDLFIGSVVAFWLIKDLPKMRGELIRMAGERLEDDIEVAFGTVNRVVGGYLKGQTIVSLITGGIAGIGLAILGVPYALLLALLVFITNYVPYVGPFIAGLAALLVALFDAGIWAGLGALVIVIVAQNLTDQIVTPRVMSDQVDLHPTLVIFSLLVGGTLFGLAGMLFAIPVAATGKGLFVYYFERRTRRTLATEDGALFRTPAACADAEGAGEPGECPPSAEAHKIVVPDESAGPDDTTRSDT